jgi:hypothetical protein
MMRGKKRERKVVYTDQRVYDPATNATVLCQLEVDVERLNRLFGHVLLGHKGKQTLAYGALTVRAKVLGE